MSTPKLYDLTQAMYHNCPGWPDYPLTTVNWDYRVIHHGFNAETVCFNTHTGTHIDVPYHFFNEGKKLDEYPYLGGPAAEMLAKAKVKAVGIDALSLGGWGGPEKGRPCHVALLPHDIFIIEELRIPEALLDNRRRYLTAFPLPLSGCGGAPARVVVYEL